MASSPNGDPDARRTLAGFTIAVTVILLIVVPIRTSCPANPLHGGGELTTVGAVNTTIVAPIFLNAGLEIPSEGTSRAKILWGGCGTILECAHCPPTLKPGVNASLLEGAILLYSFPEDASSEWARSACGRRHRGLPGSSALHF